MRILNAKTNRNEHTGFRFNKTKNMQSTKHAHHTNDITVPEIIKLIYYYKGRQIDTIKGGKDEQKLRHIRRGLPSFLIEAGGFSADSMNNGIEKLVAENQRNSKATLRRSRTLDLP